MNRIAKIGLAAVVLLLVAFAAGWYYGWRGAADRRADEANVAYSLGTARSALLEGRIELYSNNFGNAARHFDDAKRQLRQAIEFLDREKVSAQADALRQALGAVDTAIQRAGRLEPAAHDSASTAQKAIDGVIDQRTRSSR